MITKLKENGIFTQQWQLTFFYSKNYEESRTLYSKSDNTEVMMSNETDKIIEDLCDSFLQR